MRKQEDKFLETYKKKVKKRRKRTVYSTAGTITGKQKKE